MLKAGEKLKEARLVKGLTLDDVAKSTKIKTVFLEFIENGQYTKLPSISYAYGFVKNYAKFLGLPEKNILALFRREFAGESAYKVLPKGFEDSQRSPFARFKIRQTAVLMIVIFGIFISYIIFQYRYAFLNPPLEISSPKDGAVILSPEVLVLGKTDPNATVYIENNAVSLDQNGNFKKTISVFPGKKTLEIKVINKFSKETDRKIQIDVKSGY